MFSRVLAASLALVSGPAIPETSPMVFLQYPLVHRVDCERGKGSAFRIGGNHWISVAHVTALGQCRVDGEPITVTDQDGLNDFAAFDTKTSKNGMKVNCGGFIPGQYYWAVGHAFGAPFQTAIVLLATAGKDTDGKRVLIGPYNVIPGMSGGPVLNLAGEAVGTVNSYYEHTPISESRELKDTSVCSKR